MPLEAMLIPVGLFMALAMLQAYRHTKHPCRCAMLNMLGGAGCLCLLHYGLARGGISLVVNYTTLAVSALLGPPGAMSMAVYQILGA